jgi:hypothetical protein
MFKTYVHHKHISREVLSYNHNKNVMVDDFELEFQ